MGQEEDFTAVPSLNQGEGGEPSGQEPPEAPGQGTKLSSIQKLKQDRRRLQELLQTANSALESLNAENEQLKSGLESLRSEVEGLKRQQNPRGPEDYSESELWNAALDPNADELTRLKAFKYYVDKRLEGLQENVVKNLDQRLEQKTKLGAIDQFVSKEFRRIQQELGEDKLAPGSPVVELSRRYHKALIDALPNAATPEISKVLQLWSLQLAQRDFKAAQPSQEGKAGGQPEPPPPGAQLSGAPSTAASGGGEEWSKRKEELLRTGEVRQAILESLQRQM